MKSIESDNLIELTRTGYDRMAKDFSGTRMNFWHELTEMAVSRMKPGTRLLDLGCGNARFYRETPTNKALTYTGCDFSQGLIAEAKKFHRSLQFDICDVRHTPYEDCSFDMVVSFAVIHHLAGRRARQEFFDEVYRLLDCGGIALVTTWNIRKTKRREITLQYLKNLFRKPHREFGGIILPFTQHASSRYVYGLTKREFRTLAENAGLVVESIEYVHRDSKKGREENIVLIAHKK